MLRRECINQGALAGGLLPSFIELPLLINGTLTQLNNSTSNTLQHTVEPFYLLL